MNTRECPIGGPGCPGWYTPDVPFGHPDFGRAFPCVCAGHAQAERQKCSLPDSWASLRFETFAVVDRNRAALEAARAFAQADPLAGWLTITGSVGNGKTHLAVAVMNTLLELGIPVLYDTAPALLDYLRATFAPNSEVTFDDRFEAIQSARVLVLDDLGAESSTPWALDKLFQIVDHRYVHRLPTVVITNVSLPHIPDRIRSRLSDSRLGQVVINAAPDYRSAEGKKVYQAVQRVGTK